MLKLLEFKNLDNIPITDALGSVAKELKAPVISTDGKIWKTGAPLDASADDRARPTLTMPGPDLYVGAGRALSYFGSEKWLDTIRKNRLVTITPIG